MKKIISLILALTLICGLLVACTDSTDPNSGNTGSVENSGNPNNQPNNPTGPAKTVLNIGFNSNIVGLDPLNCASNSARAYSFAVFEPLVDYNHQGITDDFRPCLATEWSVDDTGCVWTFKLREGVKFHNGEDFTSADVVATYNRLINEGSSLNIKSSWWEYLSEVEADGDYSVKIKTSAPFASMLISVAMTPIMPDEAMAQYGEDFWNNQILYGTGPWKFDEWVDGAYLHLVKNDAYWDSSYNPSINEFYFRFLTEVSTAIASHISGDLDAYIVNGGIDSELLAMYSGYDNIELITTETTNLVYIGYNFSEDSAFRDDLVRQAADLAIDRELICSSIFSGNAKVPNSIIMPSMPGYDPTIPGYTYDPDKAAELLKQSSYDNHLITLYTSNSLAKSREQCLAISEMLNKVGFNTTVEAVENAAFTQLRKSGDYEMFLVNDQPMGGDLAKYLSFKVIADGHKHEYENDEMMQLARSVLTELDISRRNELMSQFARMERELIAPHTLLYYLVQTEAINKGVVNFTIWNDTCYSIKFIDYDASRS